MKSMVHEYHLHMISDSTGETLNTVAKAVGAKFEGAIAREHIYSLVRSENQLRRALQHISANPGIVFSTLVNPGLRRLLEQECRKMKLPCVSVLDPAVEAMKKYLGVEEAHRPGAQHEMDARYQERVEALNYAMQHDDGQNIQNLAEADVILVGVSRSSKTPTSIYLAIRGVRAGNIPIVPGIPPPEHLFTLSKPLFVGLWLTPERLLQIRKNRLTTMGENKCSDYVDEDAIRAELAMTRRLFESRGWPTIDVTRRSIEETAAAILNLLAERNAPQ
ncbi:MAG: kinase/pyrophosphorylase [Alphaproteobacteria bacterium]|nr:kinase/pyrophosphorylase [Alphaproteobacteria bacterium]